MLRHFEKTEGSRKIIAHLAEGNNIDMEQWIQIYRSRRDWTMNTRKTEANGIRRAEEAKREDPGRKPADAPEQGKKVSFIEEEREAKEVREWREQFVEKRKDSARSANGRRARATAAERARANNWTGAQQESVLRRRRAVRRDESGEHRRTGGDEQICGGENRKRKRK